MARICAFCGKNDVSKEHFFAKWIRDEYPDYHKNQKPSVFAFGRNETELFSYSGKTLEQGVRAFCKSCNNGWMSGLEAKAGAIMQPMVRAKKVGIKMRYAAQHTVASWAMKTALVLKCLQAADSRIPESDYRDFHRKQQPSSNVLVVMGARHIAGNTKGANIFEYKSGFAGTDSAGIQHVHFAIGALYFGIAMFIGRSRAYPRAINADAATRAALIWPVQPEVIWPCPSISDVGGVDGMFDAFTNAWWGGTYG